MADEAPLDSSPSRQMSLIPYPFQNGDVVLRRGNAAVVYDPQTQQLSVAHVADQTVDLTECPTCGQPFRDRSRAGASEQEQAAPAAGFTDDRHYVDPDYFRLLSQSQRSSPPASVGPSTSRIPPALRSGRSRDVSGSQGPPSGAEFVNSEPTTSAQEGISASAFDPGYFKRNFQVLRTLGKGGNGVVLLVEHIKDSFSLGHYACKRVPVGNNHDWLLKVLVEVQLLQKLRHPNIVAYYWTWLEDYQSSRFTPPTPCLWMLQEYCDGGDLHSLVIGPTPSGFNAAERMKERIRRRSKGEAELPEDICPASKLTLKEIFTFFKDITSGLHYLHGEGYLHRDLKPSNCLLRYTKSGPRVMISDFGEVQVAGAKRGSTGATGTISYCAPEVLRLNATDGTYGDFSTKSDIFSLGMIVYFMCFGRLPYVSTDGIDEDNEDLDQLRAEILKWTGFDEYNRARSDLPDQLYRYLKRLLSVDPSERPSTDEIDQNIRGGVGLADTSVLGQDAASHVSSVDLPKRRPSSHGSRSQATLSRPGLSSLARPRSDDAVRQAIDRSRSRNGSKSLGNSQPGSPVNGSMVMRSRTLEASQKLEEDPAPQSPRLMLPPPEQPLPGLITRTATHPMLIILLRIVLFLGKIVSMTGPCMPYQPNPWLFYPLLLGAIIDLAGAQVSSRQSIPLLLTHIALVLSATQQQSLCQVHRMPWRDT